MPSTRAVNYSVRANKHIERRMLFEALRRLDRLPPRLGGYQYIGFGGIYFTDFLLAHRDLGITDLVSIEQTNRTERFAFNKPLACIDLRFGLSGEVLPTVLAEQSSDPAIFWLDYDGPMNEAVADDVRLIAGAAASWTVLVVTVNCQPESDIDKRMEKIRATLGALLPPDITGPAQLGGWKLAELSHRLITGAVDEALTDRNAALEPNQRIRYRQIFRFHYADGAKMLTTGGILHTDAQTSLLDEALTGLPQLRGRAEAALLVDAPILTAREVRHLSGQLPANGVAPTNTPEAPGLPPSEAARFAQLYRHYPMYAQVEVL